MKTFTTLAAGAAVLALTVGAAAPAAAQSYRDYRDRDRSSSSDVLVGAAIGAMAGAALGNGDGAYIAGGALAGAALAAANDGDRRDDCGYWRDGRCWRNQGHWEREHGINSRDYRDYGYNNGYGYGDYGRYQDNRYQDGRSYDGRYYRDGRFWRNQGEWRAYQNRQNRDRDYRYERRW